MAKFHPTDLTGQVFHRLTVIKETGKDKLGNRVWECHCNCGTKIEVIAARLKAGRVKSCGCLKIDSSRKNGRDGAVSRWDLNAKKKDKEDLLDNDWEEENKFTDADAALTLQELWR